MIQQRFALPDEFSDRGRRPSRLKIRNRLFACRPALRLVDCHLECNEWRIR
jgi:hypothetical protein